MPLTLPFRAVFAASAVALSCSAALLTLLKSVLRQDPVLHDALKREVARIEAASGLPPAARSDTLPPQ